MTEKGNHLCTFFFYPVMISLPSHIHALQEMHQTPGSPVINHFHIRHSATLNFSIPCDPYILHALSSILVPYPIHSLSDTFRLPFCSRICPAQFRSLFRSSCAGNSRSHSSTSASFPCRFQTGLCRIHRPAKGRLITTSHRKR